MPLLVVHSRNSRRVATNCVATRRIQCGSRRPPSGSRYFKMMIAWNTRIVTEDELAALSVAVKVMSWVVSPCG